MKHIKTFEDAMNDETPKNNGNWFINLITNKVFLVLVIIIAVINSSPSEEEQIADNERTLKSFESLTFLDDDFEKIIKLTGCDSKHSEMKKESVFDSQYKKYLIGAGPIKVTSIEEGKLRLKMEGTSHRPELYLNVLDNSKTYDLLVGQKIAVVFRMERLGGCFLPYTGTLFDFKVLK